MTRRHIALAALVLGTSFLVVWRATSLFGVPVPIQPGVRLPHDQRDTLQAVQNTGTISSGWVRPIFRPLSTPKAANAGNPDPILMRSTQPLRLVGVLAHGASKLAVVHTRGELVRLRETDSIEGWTVTRIEARTAHLRQGDKTRILQLDPAAER